MGMAAAGENEILSDRNALLHRLHYARALYGRRAEGGPEGRTCAAAKYRSLMSPTPVKPGKQGELSISL
jgi:hypothetical protein